MQAGWGRRVRGGMAVAAWLALLPFAQAEGLRGFGPPPGKSVEARQVIDWALRTGDPGGRAFAVVDKRRAEIFVFDAAGRLAGHSQVLLGQTWGDHTVPGVGQRAQTNSVRPDERTTPAGRFDTVPGRNLQGEHVVWADYASAFAIHRLRPGRGLALREAKLASPGGHDNRASNGCVVVPVAFYEEVVRPVLGAGRGVLYVLPEAQPLQALFTALDS